MHQWLLRLHEGRWWSQLQGLVIVWYALLVERLSEWLVVLLVVLIPVSLHGSIDILPCDLYEFLVLFLNCLLVIPFLQFIVFIQLLSVDENLKFHPIVLWIEVLQLLT